MVSEGLFFPYLVYLAKGVCGERFVNLKDSLNQEQRPKTPNITTLSIDETEGG